MSFQDDFKLIIILFLDFITAIRLPPFPMSFCSLARMRPFQISSPKARHVMLTSAQLILGNENIALGDLGNHTHSEFALRCISFSIVLCLTHK